ncbi:phospholipase A-2-activating protein [Ischnura elegans]|uniref:phospholipase A-2-activating protein n=1 Tax=Ischnura elegans TaxID=197161 RepID=UPI001ED89CED|nr:phospholipase A-2-activating protein [Ischnura elegans]
MLCHRNWEHNKSNCAPSAPIRRGNVFRYVFVYCVQNFPIELITADQNPGSRCRPGYLYRSIRIRMATSTTNTYKISCQLTGHTADVRGVAVTGDGTIFSASRDKTSRVWRKNEPNVEFSEVQTLKGHTNFVSCVCFLKSSPPFKSGLLLTGGNDSLICIYEPESWTLVNKLTGHTNTVCSLSASLNEEGVFLSASWDATARLWQNGDSKVTFSGHQAAVWCVIDLPVSKLVITGSADKNIYVWSRSGDLQKRLTGHTDCVRGLAVLSPSDFLSCSNDATVRWWSAAKGECLGTYYGHSNFIYCVAAGPSGEFATSAEDGSVRVWGTTSEGTSSVECQQVIQLPSQTVWSVAYLPNGDLVTGSSDGVIRVFSREISRHASDVIQEVYQQEIAASHSVKEEEIGGVKISELPGREVLLQDGSRDGQTKLVREGKVVNCYQWVASTGSWESLGEVIGGSGGSQDTSGKTLYEGKEYDYVFNVDVEDGKPPLKLPYNKSDDPWMAAQKFIEDNNLSQYFLDQVANFIVQNSNPTPTVMEQGSSFMDPFTGENRYIPGGGAVAGGPHAGDPKTASFLVQPTAYYPQKTYIQFDQANTNAIREKLHDFNHHISPSPEYGSIQNEVLDELMKISALDSAAPLASDKHVEALKCMLRWPLDKLHPVLDLTRLAVRNKTINQALFDSPQDSEFVIGVLQKVLDVSPATTAPLLAFALRLTVNMFAHVYGEKLAIDHWSFFLSSLLALSPDSIGINDVEDTNGVQSLLRSGPVQVALSTLLLNLSVAFSGKLGSSVEFSQQREKLLEVSIEVVSRVKDSEAQFRAIVAFGTLISTYVSTPTCLRNEETRSSMAKMLGVISEEAKPPKLKECASQLKKQLVC